MSQVSHFKLRDEILNTSYQYFSELLNKHTDSKHSDCLLAATDLALLKNRLSHTYDIEKPDLEGILNDIVDKLIDTFMEDDINPTINESIYFEQLLLRAKEILLEQQTGNTNIEGS